MKKQTIWMTRDESGEWISVFEKEPVKCDWFPDGSSGFSVAIENDVFPKIEPMKKYKFELVEVKYYD